MDEALLTVVQADTLTDLWPGSGWWDRRPLSDGLGKLTCEGFLCGLATPEPV